MQRRQAAAVSERCGHRSRVDHTARTRPGLSF